MDPENRDAEAATLPAQLPLPAMTAGGTPIADANATGVPIAEANDEVTLGGQMQSVQSKLLRQLSAQDFQRLQPALEHVTLKVRARLVHADKPIEHVFFLESGLASVVAGRSSDKPIDVGMFGRDGMSGFSVVQGINQSPHDCIMQTAGSAFRLPIQALQLEMAQSETLRATLLRFIHLFMVQTGETARANGRFKVEQRLARWLLMAHDRLEGDDVPLTHEFLSMMVGSRRVGITIALRCLERLDAIRSQRGHVFIVDRGRLIDAASGCYGVPEWEDRRLNQNLGAVR